MITRCDKCLGKKTLIGLGGLIKDCPKCEGIGHLKIVLTPADIVDKEIKEIATKEYVVELKNNIENSMHKRRGRPKKGGK